MLLKKILLLLSFLKTNGEIDVDSEIKEDYSNIEPDDETLSLVTLKERRLLTAQTMFKKSIKVSLKSFLISISISSLERIPRTILPDECLKISSWDEIR